MYSTSFNSEKQFNQKDGLSMLRRQLSWVQNEGQQSNGQSLINSELIQSVYKIKMRNQNIFLDERGEKQSQMGLISIYDVDDEQYIEQFLELEKSGSNQFKKTNKISTLDWSVSNKAPRESSKLKTDKLLEEKRVSSCYHNFQKHLVLTLRNAIKLSDFEHSPQSYELEKQLWRTFLKGKRTNKTLIGLTLVSVDFIDKDKSEKRKLIRKYGFEPLLREHTELEIKEAQRNLREAVLKELRRLDISSELERRKLKDKESFMLYFKDFISELKKGNMAKRVALKKSQQNSEDSGMEGEELEEHL